jgi:hypothetical protein
VIESHDLKLTNDYYINIRVTLKKA